MHVPINTVLEVLQYVESEDKSYKKLFNEEILDSFMINNDKKFFIFEIENLKELEKLKGNPRGVIANNKLYILNDKGLEFIHTKILFQLKKLHILRNNISINTFWDNIFSIKDFLCVQYINKKMNIGESYNNDFLKEISDWELEEYLNKHLNVLKKLHIPYKFKKYHVENKDRSYKRLFSEKAVQIDISWVKPILLKVKSKLVGHDYGNLEIENILNKVFSNYFVKFYSGFDSETGIASYAEVGIIKGSIYDNGLIRIDYFSDFYKTFENNDLYNNFINVVSSIIYHERIHKYQLSKHMIKQVDMSSNFTYLSNKHEIQAHAQQAIFDLLSSGYSVSEIEKKLKSKSEMNDLISSDAFWFYYDHFGLYYNPKEKDKYNYVWPLFLKYMYSALQIKEV
jgi:hypothetical protein